MKERICSLFVETLMHYRDRQAFLLHAFVLMPDHFHALLTPGDDIALERAVQYIKGGSAHRIGQELRFRFPVWQRGFSDHRIRDGADYEAHMRYIEQNPVTLKLVATASEYRWSSASGKFPLDGAPQGLKPLARTPADGTAEAVP